MHLLAFVLGVSNGQVSCKMLTFLLCFIVLLFRECTSRQLQKSCKQLKVSSVLFGKRLLPLSLYRSHSCLVAPGWFSHASLFEHSPASHRQPIP